MATSASLQARLDRLAQENQTLRSIVADARKEKDAQQAQERKESLARYAHRDGTSLPIRQGGKSSAKSVVLFAGQAHGDVAVSGLRPLAVTRTKSGIK